MSKILFQLSGSISAYKACAAISRLAQSGHEVQTVATANALRFVGAATLEGLSGRPALTDAFASGKAMQHLDALKWADLAILCPASANAINKLASGVGDDLISTIFLGHGFNKPYLIAPAMNQRMHAHPATQASIAKLRAWGANVLETGAGALACGEYGAGRLLEPDEIVRAVENALAAPSRGRVLVTSGGTREPIDSVRAIANFSTGRTGAAIAMRLAASGFDVTLARARDAARPTGPIKQIEFVTSADLDRALRAELAGGAYRAVVHAAAVADYAVAGVDGSPWNAGEGKLDSERDVALRLTRQPKLLGKLREYAQKPIVVVAFKLTSGATSAQKEEKTARLMRESAPDFVVQNDLSDLPSHGDAHPSVIVDSRGAEFARCEDKEQLARAIERAIAKETGT